MINAAINIFIYSLLNLIIGLYKPKWPLFWMKNPNRFTVIMISTVLFMVAATLFGEGKRVTQPDLNQSTGIIEAPNSQPVEKEKENKPNP